MPTPILMPRQGQSVESCLLVQWKVKCGDTVQHGQPVASIETDKAVFEVESPATGTILELFFAEGADVPVLSHIAAVGAPGEDVSSLRPGAAPESKPETPATKKSTVSTAPAPAAAPSRHEPAVSSSSRFASPRARNLAAQQGMDARSLRGTGPGGRVIERDVRAAAVCFSSPGAEMGPYTEIPVRGIRKLIADRMMQSLGTTAQLTMTMSFEATALQTLREKAKKSGEKITINDIIVFCTARTLKKHPALNAHFLGEKIISFESVHLGIAVDTPRGLMVPVVRDANQLPLRKISSAIRPLAQACQDGSIQPDHLSGGTFTITNLGALGVEAFTPVLNAPQVAILGVGAPCLKPVKRNGTVEFSEFITISLTVDHQVVDGAPGARFMKDLCTDLETIQE